MKKEEAYIIINTLRDISRQLQLTSLSLNGIISYINTKVEEE